MWLQHNGIANAIHPLLYITSAVVIAVLAADQFATFVLFFGLFKRHKVDLPVIVVGNISVGGTGKTPTVLRFS